MRSQGIVGFGKTRSCPPTEALRLYAESTLCGERLDEVNTHLCACDFCGAETQLLSRFPPPASAASHAAREMPPALRRLAEELLHEPSLERARFIETIYEIERLSLTDA